MPRFLSATGESLSGSTQRLPLGDSLTIGVSAGAGCSVAVEDPSVAGVIELGADSSSQRWFKLTGRRVAQARVEVRGADAGPVHDAFLLAVLREVPLPARPAGALEPGPDYARDPAYIDHVRAAYYDLRTGRLRVEHRDGSRIELDHGRIQRDIRRPGIGATTLEAHTRSPADGKIYPRHFDRISTPHIAALAAEIARVLPETASLLRAGEEILRLVPVAGPVPGSRGVAWTHAPPSARETAESLAARLRRAGQRVIVDLYGTGEVPNAINLDPHVVHPRVFVPSLVRAHAERLGELFAADSIDTILGQRLPPNTLSWSAVLRGAHRVLKPGAPIVLRFQEPGNDARSILLGFQHLRFREIRNEAGRVLRAIK